MQRTLFIAALLTVCSASSIASTPAPPAWLAPYIVKGALSYSNLDWARRRWSPDPKDQLEWRSALDWIAQFKGARAAEIVEDFRQAGVPGATLRAGCYGNEACQQVEDLQLGSAAFSGWDTLSGAAREATPYIEGYRYAVETTAHVVTTDPSTTLHDKLIAARILDQTNMIGLTGFHYPEQRLPSMSAHALAVFNLTVTHFSRMRFEADAAMLKTAVAARGWPRRSEIGESGMNAAWLVVQHADYDPLFQYKALQLIKARAQEGEGDPKNVAYLYDRIMLKVTGKQRYGTQLECKEGKLEPQPLEDAEHLDSLRKEMNLPSFAEYLRGFPENTCRDAAPTRR